VYTVDPAQPWAEALAIRDGRIVAVGSSDDLAARFEAKATRDLAGQMVLPGFHDAHVHPEGAGIELTQCDLNEAATVDAIVAKVRDCVATTPVTAGSSAAAGISRSSRRRTRARTCSMRSRRRARSC